MVLEVGGHGITDLDSAGEYQVWDLCGCFDAERSILRGFEYIGE